MSRLLYLDLENGIYLVPAGRQEAVRPLPIVLFSNNHQEMRNPFEMSAFQVERSG
jgi:hypothetical protein